MIKTIKTLKRLPKPDALPAEPLPMAFEAPHAKIARLNRELQETTEALQELKRGFAELNVKAQAARQAIATSQITAYKTAHREMADRILATQNELASVHRELRARKAERMGNGNGKAQPEANAGNGRSTKKMPLAQHPELPAYFILAARDELAEGLYQQVMRTAKSLLKNALDMGVEQ